jgi:hypothetical protein
VGCTCSVRYLGACVCAVMVFACVCCASPDLDCVVSFVSEVIVARSAGECMLVRRLRLCALACAVASVVGVCSL